ncbi:MAG: ABC transporter permease [Thermoprotei archaeon]|nr:MAG: ABC transporter permease [Thermoprotei archaeon]
MISKRAIKRIAYSLATLFAATTILFIVVHNIPGDVIYVWVYDIVETYGVSWEEAERIARVMFLGYEPDKPLWQQYIDYIRNLLRGNLGYSPTFRLPVNAIVASALPWTLFILSLSLSTSFIIGVLLGMFIAWKRKTIIDPIVSAYAAFTDATPDFVTAMLLFIFLAVRLGLFPLKGAYDAEIVTPGFNLPFIANVLWHAALPVLSYVIEHIGAWTLLMKGSAVSVLEEDYVRAAIARGLRESRVVTAYIGRTAIIPLVALIAISIGSMMGGSILIETVFTYPGMGYFFAQAIGRMDYALMQGLFFLIIAGVILANLVVDLIYPIIDPRAREE